MTTLLRLQKRMTILFGAFAILLRAFESIHFNDFQIVRFFDAVCQLPEGGGRLALTRPSWSRAPAAFTSFPSAV
jgi:hypothetical protein